MRIENKPVIWITGGSKGIGFAIAQRFAASGAVVAISARDKKTLEQAHIAIAETGADCIACACDVRNEKSVDRALSAIEKIYHKVDILINNAGISPVLPFASTPLAVFDEAIAVNLRGMFACSQAVAQGMMKRKSGTIVNILSTAAVRAFSGNAAYCASKFGALGLTRVMRTEMKKYGVRVLAVFPGAVETEMWGAAERKKYHARMLQPEDVAAAVFDAVSLDSRAVAEEIILRPLGGDL